MQVEHQYSFSYPAQQVALELINPITVKARALSSGAVNPSVDILDNPDNLVVSLKLQVGKEQIPSEFHSFLPANLELRYSEVWQKEVAGEADSSAIPSSTAATATATPIATAQISASIVEAPGRISGVAEVWADPDHPEQAAIFKFTGTVVSSTLLFKSAIEKAVAKALLVQLKQQLAVVEVALSQQV